MRKSTNSKASSPKPKPAASKAKLAELIPHESYVTGLVIDVAHVVSKAGNTGVKMTLSVSAPRLYRGKTLYFALYDLMDLGLENFEKHFGFEFLDTEKIWEQLGGLEVRARVVIKEAHGEYGESNGVSSIYPVKNSADIKAAVKRAEVAFQEDEVEVEELPF